MSDETTSRVDVLVAGGAAAGLCAAIAARRAGASVRLVEAAPAALRGGNTRHARNFRIAHDGPARYVPDGYRPEEFWADLVRVTGGDTDEPLARTLIRASATIAPWLIANGVLLQALDQGVLPYSRRTAFLFGGGKAMVNALYATARQLGVAIACGTELTALRFGDDGCEAEVAQAGTGARVIAKAVVVATGGYQADPARLRIDFGAAAERMVVRGSPYCTGRGLDLLLDAGAVPVGDPASAHIVAVDARGPRFDGGIVTRITGIPHGIVVDRTAKRLADERADTRRTHYAQWGARIAACPDQLAYLIVDQDGLRRAGPTALPPVAAPTLAELARRLELDPAALDATVRAFNAEAAGREPAVRPLTALPLAAWPLLPGLTFTHFGVAVDARMRVLLRGDRVAPRVFAAGTAMAANVLRHGYLAGLGVTLAAVTGRIAGEEAARAAA
ncbi:FAD-dependent tricarballylate dehydrogenase TcuA [Rhodoplanes sp. TEM]|uniref:FAD-dependent tricarballylate dehydrogenase TcuA n=1 Tax=Rhodoplanes tepidamans TaxID=200616 RepID=A0ABT5J892_RHOTP|nr:MULTISPECIES: FAD-dependent tricarballylate dehydrogenase TcuA [Rhodoplanes]MDC7785878.1 FAD-dependent tricarballylate dehydrogenase TcuA [Rhodoplanes tepidamans]MDC7984990.1 FAD-dependent tricarballylate dehydrogenase TcuA [Rhodoplanes sp. TEM]MDQ0355504.1 tricarballylate dehydrogenase [Rhodoplanes tepidamans]